MRLLTLLLATVTLLAALLAGQIAVRSQRPAGYLMASWKDRPATLKATVDLAEEVVVGKVSKIKKADPIVTQAPGEPGNADSIPVEVVTITVSDNVKGRKTTIELFHTGHSDAVSPMDKREPGETPPPRPSRGAVPKSQRPRDPGSHGGVIFSVMDDPGYKVGEEYVLFVRKGPKLKVEGADVDTLAIVSPEGRFHVKGDKTIEPLSTRAFAQGFKGKPVKDLRDRAAAAARP